MSCEIMVDGDYCFVIGTLKEFFVRLSLFNRINSDEYPKKCYQAKKSLRL